jgi:hypothetical protein
MIGLWFYGVVIKVHSREILKKRYLFGQTTGAKTMPKSRAYQDELAVYLQDSQRAIAYLNGALEEDDPEFFLLALQNVARARGKAVRLPDRDEESGQLVLNWHELMSLLKDLDLDLTVKEAIRVA